MDLILLLRRKVGIRFKEAKDVILPIFSVMETVLDSIAFVIENGGLYISIAPFIFKRIIPRFSQTINNLAQILRKMLRKSFWNGKNLQKSIKNMPDISQMADVRIFRSW